MGEDRFLQPIRDFQNACAAALAVGLTDEELQNMLDDAIADANEE